jgi:FAD/FMN-containing dehydrogenase
MSSEAPIYLDRLASAVGAPHVAWSGGPLVVRPGSAAEVGDVIRVAREVGSAVGLGGETPIEIDLGRMRNVLDLDETSLLLSVQAGVTLEELEELLGERGLTLGALPQISRTRTIGALLAAPRPSEATPRVGPFTAACAGLTALVADGTTIATRVAPRKSTGPDLMHALIGSRGILGIITAATLRLERRGDSHEEAAWALPSIEDALACARALIVRGGRPADLAVTASPAPTLSLVADGPAALVQAEHALAHRIAVERGGRPVPHTPPPLVTAPPYERFAPLETIDQNPPPSSSLRAVGWHAAGAAFVDPERPAAPPPPLHPILAALKRRLDPERRLPLWPGEPGEPGLRR